MEGMTHENTYHVDSEIFKSSTRVELFRNQRFPLTKMSEEAANQAEEMLELLEEHFFSDEFADVFEAFAKTNGPKFAGPEGEHKLEYGAISRVTGAEFAVF